MPVKEKSNQKEMVICTANSWDSIKISRRKMYFTIYITRFSINQFSRKWKTLNEIKGFRINIIFLLKVVSNVFVAGSFFVKNIRVLWKVQIFIGNKYFLKCKIFQNGNNSCKKESLRRKCLLEIKLQTLIKEIKDFCRKI